MAIYQEVRKDLLKKIRNGDYKAGNRLPSERDLCQTYGVSRMTIRQALSDLTREGVIERITGRGTFVTAPKLYQDNLRSFTQTLIDRGITPTTKVIESSKVLYIRQISGKMGLDMEEPYYKIKRLRLGDDVPFALETVYIPVKYAPDLIDQDLSQSLYGLLKDRYGYDVNRISCEVEASLPSRIMVELFELKKQTALLKVTGISYHNNDEPLFYEESYYQSELYKYHIDLYS